MRKYRQAEVIFRFPSLHSELPSLSLSLSIYFSSYLLSHSLRDEKRRIDRKFLFGGGYLPVSVRRGDLCRCAPNPSLTPFNVNAITVLVVYPVQPSSISSFFLPFPFLLSLFFSLLFPCRISRPFLCSLQRAFRRPDGRVTFSESITQLVSMCSPWPFNWLNGSLHVHR